MNKQTKQITVEVLTASEGMWITQASETDDRVFAKTLRLAINDDADNWTEWTNEQKTAYEEEQAQKAEEARKALEEAEKAEQEQTGEQPTEEGTAEEQTGETADGETESEQATE